MEIRDSHLSVTFCEQCFTLNRWKFTFRKVLCTDVLVPCSWETLWIGVCGSAIKDSKTFSESPSFINSWTARTTVDVEISTTFYINASLKIFFTFLYRVTTRSSYRTPASHHKNQYSFSLTKEVTHFNFNFKKFI